MNIIYDADHSHDDRDNSTVQLLLGVWHKSFLARPARHTQAINSPAGNQSCANACCRPIQPKIVSKWFYLAVALVAYLGGLLGVALSGAFKNEWAGETAPDSRYWVVSPSKYTELFVHDITCVTVLHLGNLLTLNCELTLLFGRK